MMKKSDFFYDLPEHLIAQYPLSERTSSRLLCLDRSSGAVTDRNFTDITDLCRKGDLLVFNNTRVIPARLYAHKASGGKVEILIERIESAYQVLAHVKASKSPKPGSTLRLAQGLQVEVLGRVDDLFRLRFSDTVSQVMTLVGHMPLPPYINRSDEGNDALRYQTVFATQAGAVAAPTAGLHLNYWMCANRKNSLRVIYRGHSISLAAYWSSALTRCQNSKMLVTNGLSFTAKAEGVLH
jgi:S-adenosylmethionine:tRNA ribosyltransferase-isomerase